MAAQLRFVRLHLNKPKTSGKSPLDKWDEVVMFVQNAYRHIWQKQNASYGECYGATDKATYSLAVTHLTMNSSGYQSILKSNVRSSVQQKKFSPNWTIQEDNDPNHRVKTTIQWLGEKIKASTFMTVKCWQEQMICISTVQLRNDENDVNNKIITA